MVDFFSARGMNILDLILIVILLGSLIWGVVRGLVREVLTLLSWGLSLGLAWRYGDHLGNYLMSWLKSAQFSYYAGIGLVFLVSLVAFTVISRVMYSQFRITDLMMTNRLLGVIFGTIRGIVISTFLLFAVQFSPAIDTDWYKESQLVPYFTPLVIFTDKSISQKLWHREI